MTHPKTASTLLALLVIALCACSSSFGDGSRPPQDVTVVVPPSGN